MSYISVHIEEIESREIDSSIILIYDENEETFYLYGTRCKGFYKHYSFTYHYTQLDSLIFFIKLVLNNNPFNISYNHLYIPDKDLDYVDYNYLRESITRNNEIIAYDGLNKLNTNKLKKNLAKLYDIIYF